MTFDDVEDFNFPSKILSSSSSEGEESSNCIKETNFENGFLSEDDDTDDIIKNDNDASFEDIQTNSHTQKRFLNLPLSRRTLMNLNKLGFKSPTPIQLASIPAIMAGKNILATSKTGSGKTAAFLVPVIERFTHTEKKMRPHALVILPTRELALQCWEVATKLTDGTDVAVGLAAGGLPVGGQKAFFARAAQVEIIIGTPGRILELSRSAISKKKRLINLKDVGVLILDEADRILEEGFEKELSDIKNACSMLNKQTLLFSATLSPQDAAKWIESSQLSPEPTILQVDSSSSLSDKLTQQFIRLRKQDEINRLAMLVAILNRIPLLKKRVIIFVGRKEECRKISSILCKLGLSIAELHGDLKQTERNLALKRFKERETDLLVATDVAARGIDVTQVQAVVNYTMPATYPQYQHRVGRTARAGFAGFSISLVGESDRKILKEAIKHAPFSHRVIPASAIEKYRSIINKFLAK
jgi:ATP-dependent RNA helicase DDX27